MEFDRSKLASYDELMEEVITTIVETSSGRLYEIRKVEVGDLLRAAGSPIMKILTAKGVDVSSQENAEKSIQAMPQEEQANILADPEFTIMARDLVCSSVLNVNLVNKPQSECVKELMEVSVDKLPLKELVELFTMTMTLSVAESDIKDFHSFREDGEEEQDEYGEVAPDGEGVREETDGAVVQEEQEPTSADGSG